MDARAEGTPEINRSVAAHFSRPYGDVNRFACDPALKRRDTFKRPFRDPRCARFRQLCTSGTSAPTSPDAAGVGMHHRLSGVAAVGVGKFRHVAHHIVYAVPIEGVSLRHHRGTSRFRTEFSAPDVGPGEEEVLQFSGAVLGFPVEIFALRLESVLQAGESDADTAVVGRCLLRRRACRSASRLLRERPECTHR
jgi:hypothetical protein